MQQCISFSLFDLIKYYWNQFSRVFVIIQQDMRVLNKLLKEKGYKIVF